ncbi:hypothetical protein ACLEPN_26475 [Myxococcus sp. 1LA]
MHGPPPRYVYNYLGLEIFYVRQDDLTLLPPGKYKVRMDFTYEGGEETGQGGKVRRFREVAGSDVKIGEGLQHLGTSGRSRP